MVRWAWSLPAFVAVLLQVAGCGDGAAHGDRANGTPARHATAHGDRANGTPAPRATPRVTPLRTGPCQPTTVRRQGAPAWTRVSQVPEPPFPYAIASGAPVAAVFFSYPLRADLAPRTRNKILWVVGLRPKADVLVISARSATTPSRRLQVRAEVGGSGRVQRSLLQFPVSGCWRLMLRWEDHVGRLDVRVRPRHG